MAATVVRRIFAIAGITLAVIGLVFSAAAHAQEDSPSGQATHDRAADLVRQALTAEAAGLPTERAALLAAACRIAPDYAPAHWQSGQVRVAGAWLPLDEAVSAAIRAGKVDQYRRQRDKAADTYSDQIKLAHFCSGAGLKEQERVHLANVLRLHPDSPEATRKLDLTRYRGKYMSRAQIAALKQAAQQQSALIKKWGPQFVQLHADLQSGDSQRSDAATERLSEIRDPEAIPALEQFTLASGPDIGQVVVTCLSDMPQQAGTDSLVRHSLYAPDARVRHAAAEALRPRSIYSYVPTLMANLQLPVDVQFQTFLLDDGRPAHRLTMFQEGLFGSQSFTSEGALIATLEYSRRNARVDGAAIGDPTLNSDLALASTQTQVNAVRETTNQRVADALQTTVNQKFGADPKAWWDWWAQYNELYISPDKPVSFTSRYTPTAPIQVRYHSCFVADTGVWTMTGMLPIDKLTTGECVLSKNVETGELAYKPVVATTVRPPSALVEIHCGGTTIRATRGHPFWVAGLGWQMAKELKPGQYLHGATGPVLIDEIRSADEQECYNLVVADNGNYFVSDAKVLVHDNNIRDVTPATVPGLLP